MTPDAIRQAFEEWAEGQDKEWDLTRNHTEDGYFYDYAQTAYEAWVVALAWRENLQGLSETPKCKGEK